MQHASLSTLPCPIARGLDRVGEWWNIMILRDAFHGITRFDQFQKSLGIAPNILSRRLRGLVEAGLLEKIRYNDRPPRAEYVLTAIGQDFRPVLRAMFAWGNKHLAAKGPSLLMADRASSRGVEPVMVAAGTLAPITLDNVVLVAGPRASRDMHRRLDAMRALRPDLTA